MMTHSELSKAVRDQTLRPIEELVVSPNCGLQCVGTGKDFFHCNACLRCGESSGFETTDKFEARKALPESHVLYLSEESIGIRASLWDSKKGYYTDKGCSLSITGNRKLMSEVCLRHTCIYGVSKNG